MEEAEMEVEGEIEKRSPSCTDAEHTEHVDVRNATVQGSMKVQVKGAEERKYHRKSHHQTERER